MCQSGPWGAITVPVEAHSKQRGQPPRMRKSGELKYGQKGQRVPPFYFICTWTVIWHLLLLLKGKITHKLLLLMHLTDRHKMINVEVYLPSMFVCQHTAMDSISFSYLTAIENPLR